jgi:hypothetical protein
MGSRSRRKELRKENFRKKANFYRREREKMRIKLTNILPAGTAIFMPTTIKRGIYDQYNQISKKH